MSIPLQPYWSAEPGHWKFPGGHMTGQKLAQVIVGSMLGAAKTKENLGPLASTVFCYKSVYIFTFELI